MVSTWKHTCLYIYMGILYSVHSSLDIDGTGVCHDDLCTSVPILEKGRDATLDNDLWSSGSLQSDTLYRDAYGQTTVNRERQGPDDTRRHRRAAGNPDVAIRRINGTIITDCRIDGHVFRWDNFKRKIMPEKLNGKEVIYMTLWRTPIQHRFFDSKMTPLYKMRESEFFGLIRTANGTRYLVLPKVVQDGKCRYAVTDEMVEATHGSTSGFERVYNMFVSKSTVKKGFKLVSTDNQVFRLHNDSRDTIGFRTFKLLPGFFDQLNEEDRSKARKDIDRRSALLKIYYSYIKEKQKKTNTTNAAKNFSDYLRRERRSTKGKKPKPILTKFRVTCGYSRWGSDKNDIKRVTAKYFKNQFESELTDMIKPCYDVIEGSPSCATLNSKWPDWQQCSPHTQFCKYHFGRSTDSHSASNEDVGSQNIYLARYLQRASTCTSAKINSNILQLIEGLNWEDADIREAIESTDKNLADTSKKFTKHIEKLTGDVNTTFEGLETASTERLALQQEIKDLTYALGNVTKTQLSQEHVEKTVIETLKEARLGRIDTNEARITDLEAYVTKRGEIDGAPFVGHNYHEPVYGDLDEVLNQTKKNINGTQKTITHLNATLKDVVHHFDKKMQTTTDDINILKEQNRKNEAKWNESRLESERARQEFNESKTRADEALKEQNKAMVEHVNLQLTGETPSGSDLFSGSGSITGLLGGSLMMGGFGLGLGVINCIGMLINCMRK